MLLVNTTHNVKRNKMTNVKIAFYRAENGKFGDKLIAWWTRPTWWKIWESSLYSHVEIVLPNGVWVTSSYRESVGIVARNRGVDYENTTQKWEIVEIPDVPIQTAWRIYQEEVGKKYDWLGIYFTEFLPLRIENPEKWYCSEFCAHAIGETRTSVSPQGLYEQVKKRVLSV